MKILIADDHTLFRDALMQYIERAQPDADVFPARDINDAMEVMSAHPAMDIVLLDLKMPGMGEFAGLKKGADT